MPKMDIYNYVTAEDSEIIMTLARQLPKDTYAERTLIDKLRKVGGERPKHTRIADIPREIREAGNRWGITYDVSSDKYLVWGGSSKKKIPYAPKTVIEPVTVEQMEVMNEVIRILPRKTMAWSSFVTYFSTVISNIGYAPYPTANVTSAILAKKIKADVEIDTKNQKITITGGRGLANPSKNRRYY